ncbi:S-methyl-5-thioribose-1-phosphate isomerase [Candidatus Marsarchaeota G1 archaeon BE_D]|jgi:S-methyl-5-thioribose-1-phosphate isomerase|nr:MAG: S-methyl-5-thioribose-1-phosphate isomerase [Candidatus Marsarchaeota G1 archaeon BE_D]
MAELSPVKWEEECVSILDQRLLPFKIERIRCETVEQVAYAIKTLAVRGAPALGVTAGYAVALAAKKCEAQSKELFLKKVERYVDLIKSTRPTARNLFWAADRVFQALKTGESVEEMRKKALAEALLIHKEEIEVDRRLSEYGAELIEDGDSILTHCNTGELATAGYGTALGVIKMAWEKGKRITVYATETRPLLQGARLTTLELINAGIPTKLIADSSAGYLMKLKKVNMVIVGADRILKDGTTANKIGTYTLAVLAKEHGLPFYVAAPLSTFDLERDEIPIEQRSQEEVKSFQSCKSAPDEVEAWNPAFDITPPNLITGIITEKGVLHQPYVKSVKKAFERLG